MAEICWWFALTPNPSPSGRGEQNKLRVDFRPRLLEQVDASPKRIQTESEGRSNPLFVFDADGKTQYYRNLMLDVFRRIRHTERYDVTPEWVVHHLIQRKAEYQGERASACALATKQ